MVSKQMNLLHLSSKRCENFWVGFFFLHLNCLFSSQNWLKILPLYRKHLGLQMFSFVRAFIDKS